MDSHIKPPERTAEKKTQISFLTPRHDNDVNQAEWAEHF